MLLVTEMAPHRWSGTLPKLCECGCGQPVSLARWTDPRRGHVKGQPKRFIGGHNNSRAGLSLEERFWAKVDKTPGHGPWGDCWVWTGGNDGLRGYGHVSCDGRLRKASRVAWFIATGSWPALWCLRRCDYPPCVRFDHLFEGTAADNAADRDAKGRSGTRKLTAADVAAIRAAWPGIPQRELARRFGVVQQTVSMIVNQKVWLG